MRCEECKEKIPKGKGAWWRKKFLCQKCWYYKKNNITTKHGIWLKMLE